MSFPVFPEYPDIICYDTWHARLINLLIWKNFDHTFDLLKIDVPLKNIIEIQSKSYYSPIYQYLNLPNLETYDKHIKVIYKLIDKGFDITTSGLLHSACIYSYYHINADHCDRNHHGKGTYEFVSCCNERYNPISYQYNDMITYNTMRIKYIKFLLNDLHLNKTSILLTKHLWHWYNYAGSIELGKPIEFALLTLAIVKRCPFFIIKLLVENGSPVTLQYNVIIQIMENRHDIFEYIYKHPTFNNYMLSDQGYTFLHVACMNYNVSQAIMLIDFYELEQKYDFIMSHSKTGYNVLTYAFQNNLDAVVRRIHLLFKNVINKTNIFNAKVDGVIDIIVSYMLVEQSILYLNA